MDGPAVIAASPAGDLLASPLIEGCLHRCGSCGKARHSPFAGCRRSIRTTPAPRVLANTAPLTRQLPICSPRRRPWGSGRYAARNRCRRRSHALADCRRGGRIDWTVECPDGRPGCRRTTSGSRGGVELPPGRLCVRRLQPESTEEPDPGPARPLPALRGVIQGNLGHLGPVRWPNGPEDSRLRANRTFVT